MQGVLVFASEAARNAAITSPQEGQFAFTKDNNSLWYYTGSAWAASGATGDIEGVTAGVGISGGGTSGTVTITNDMATTITASGDIVVGTGNGTYDNLPIGSTGQILTADTTVSPYKVKWAAAASGGSMTELASQTFSNTASHTFSSISGSYKALTLLLRSVRSTTNEQPIRIRFNSDTGTSYNQSAWTDSGSVALANTGITVLRDPRESFATTLGWVYIMDYANAVTHKMAEVREVQSSTGGGGGYVQYGQLGVWSGTAAITSITIYAASGNLQAGTAILYGVN
jgi:hypothetical protein